jgi:iron complex outermembrane receptor protein
VHTRFFDRARAPACLIACLSLNVNAQEVHAQEVHEEVIVHGVPLPRSPEEMAQPVTVLSGEALDRVRAANLGETLANQLGVSASYFGAGASRPIIRGLAGPRVRTMEDGIDSLDVSTVSVDHAVGIDPLAAEQIEIFRGPTTLLYGSGAVGGVVNTVTNRIPESAPDDGFDGAVELRGDTVADDRTLSLAFDGGSDSVAWHIDAMTRDADNYKIPGFAELPGPEDHNEAEPVDEAHDEVFGVLENSDFSVDSLAGGISWLGDSGFFGVAVSSFESNYGLPGHHEHETDAVPEAEQVEEAAVRIDLAQTRIDLKGGWFGLNGPVEVINLRFGINDYQHTELEGAEIGTLFDNDAYEGRIEFLHTPWGEWQGAFGLQLSKREFSAIGEEAFVPPTDTTNYGLFLIEQREAGLWQYSLGARVDGQKHDPSGSLPSFDATATSVSIAATRSLGSAHAIVFNLANAERLPGAEELFSNGPHLASGNFEIGNATLGGETSRHLDLGFRKTDGDLTWSVTTFTTDYDDYIYLRDIGATDIETGLPIFTFTQSDADFNGLEAEIFTPFARPGSGELDVRLFADYVKAELDSGEPLPRIPPRRFGARLQYHNERLMAGIEATLSDDQDRVAPNEEPTPGYTMLNADLRFTVATRSTSDYELFLRATNLLDEDARRHTSFLKSSTPLPGRNYSVGFRASF